MYLDSGFGLFSFLAGWMYSRDTRKAHRNAIISKKLLISWNGTCNQKFKQATTSCSDHIITDTLNHTEFNPSAAVCHSFHVGDSEF